MPDPTLAEARKRLEELAGAIERHHEAVPALVDEDNAELAADLRNLLSALDRAAEALGPFAEASAHLHPAQPDDGLTLDGIEVRHWRRAASLHAQLTQDPGHGGCDDR